MIDEAHNLVHRGREMFSAVLVKEDFLLVKKLLKGRAARVERELERCNRRLLEMKRESAVMEDYIRTVYLDRPFVYLILDCESGIPVFMGIVTQID